MNPIQIANLYNDVHTQSQILTQQNFNTNRNIKTFNNNIFQRQPSNTQATTANLAFKNSLSPNPIEKFITSRDKHYDKFYLYYKGIKNVHTPTNSSDIKKLINMNRSKEKIGPKTDKNELVDRLETQTQSSLIRNEDEIAKTEPNETNRNYRKMYPFEEKKKQIDFGFKKFMINDTFYSAIRKKTILSDNSREGKADFKPLKSKSSSKAMSNQETIIKNSNFNVIENNMTKRKENSTPGLNINSIDKDMVIKHSDLAIQRGSSTLKGKAVSEINKISVPVINTSKYSISNKFNKTDDFTSNLNNTGYNYTNSINNSKYFKNIYSHTESSLSPDNASSRYPTFKKESNKDQHINISKKSNKYTSESILVNNNNISRKSNDIKRGKSNTTKSYGEKSTTISDFTKLKTVRGERLNTIEDIRKNYVNHISSPATINIFKGNIQKLGSNPSILNRFILSPSGFNRNLIHNHKAFSKSNNNSKLINQQYFNTNQASNISNQIGRNQINLKNNFMNKIKGVSFNLFGDEIGVGLIGNNLTLELGRENPNLELNNNSSNNMAFINDANIENHGSSKTFIKVDKTLRVSVLSFLGENVSNNLNLPRNQHNLRELHKISFFKNFKKILLFKNWRSFTGKTKYNKNRKNLTSNLSILLANDNITNIFSQLNTNSNGTSNQSNNNIANNYTNPSDLNEFELINLSMLLKYLNSFQSIFFLYQKFHKSSTDFESILKDYETLKMKIQEICEEINRHLNERIKNFKTFKENYNTRSIKPDRNNSIVLNNGGINSKKISQSNNHSNRHIQNSNAKPNSQMGLSKFSISNNVRGDMKPCSKSELSFLKILNLTKISLEEIFSFSLIKFLNILFMVFKSSYCYFNKKFFSEVLNLLKTKKTEIIYDLELSDVTILSTIENSDKIENFIKQNPSNLEILKNYEKFFHYMIKDISKFESLNKIKNNF